MCIAVIGSINTDLTIRLPHIPQRHETVVGTGGYVISQGGKGANQAVAAARGGGRVAMIGKVGADDFGSLAVDSLVTSGVNCDHVVRLPDVSTGLAAILVDANGDNAISVAPGANAALTPEDIRKAEPVIADAHIVMLQLEIPVETVNEAVSLAHKHGALVMLTPAPAPAQPLECLTMVDYLLPNEIEAESLTGLPAQGAAGPEAMAHALLRTGTKNVVLTLGARGCFIADAHTQELIAPFEVTAVDTTGAGDAFSGFLAISLARGLSLPEAARTASAAAALSVTRSGARSNLPDWQEVERFMAV